MKKYLAIISVLLYSFVACSDEEQPAPNPDPIPDPPKTYENFTLEDGDVKAVFQYVEGVGYAVSMVAAGEAYISKPPVCLEVYARGMQMSEWYKLNYADAVLEGKSAICRASVITKAGSCFNVTDRYIADGSKSSVRLSRSVVVSKVKDEDRAFNSYVLLGSSVAARSDNYDYFIPSILYKDASNLPPGAIGSNLSHEWILAREERAALPLAMIHHKGKGTSVSLTDINLNPATFKGDQGMSHVVNEDMEFGSLGFHLANTETSLAYCYPGTEGEYSYADGGRVDKKRWARRSHPVRSDIVHEYTLEFRFEPKADFPTAMAAHWQAAFNLYDPQLLDVDSEDVIKYCIEVLDHYYMEDNGVPGFPFSVYLPGGAVCERSYAMGFVGMQPACAFYLYRIGVETNNETYCMKGEKILDFWANNCLNDAGMPRVWWDISPWNFFRNENDIRNMQGGMEAIIGAWMLAEAHAPGSKQNWLNCCKRAADWMLAQQQVDGTWCKTFNSAGVIMDRGKFLTSNLIRFLTYMYAATGESKYKDAALKAGDFCYEEMHVPYKYIGSVIDNPYVKDRESGQKAIEAFLALYDLSGDEKWLDAASQAAYYTATYMYAWNIPVETGDTPLEWPRDKTSVGLTIIATGHSGADCGFSYNSFEYLRLYILTGNRDFLRIAELLEKNTKQTMDYDGTLGYAYRGLQTEAIRVVTPRGYGVKLWLPWVTASALDPLFKMKDAYGQVGVSKIALRPLSELKLLDKMYQKKQGMNNE